VEEKKNINIYIIQNRFTKAIKIILVFNHTSKVPIIGLRKLIATQIYTTLIYIKRPTRMFKKHVVY